VRNLAGGAQGPDLGDPLALRPAVVELHTESRNLEIGTGHMLAAQLKGVLQGLHQLAATDPGVEHIVAEGKYSHHISLCNGTRFPRLNGGSNSYGV